MESLELQWLDDLTRNYEGTVRLVSQTVNENEKSIQLTFAVNNNDNGCESAFTITDLNFSN